MRSSAGPKPKSSVAQGLPPSWIGLALISTPFSIRNASSPGSTKEGSVVVKVLTALGGLRAGGRRARSGLRSGLALGRRARLDPPAGR